MYSASTSLDLNLQPNPKPNQAERVLYLPSLGACMAASLALQAADLTPNPNLDPNPHPDPDP